MSKRPTVAGSQRPRPGDLCLDHVSHFVPDLEAASGVLAALGFKVTPISVQKTQEGPAGSSNRCVMLREGYIELLTPTHDTPTARRMRGAIERHVGVHLLCFGTPTAEAEHARLAAHGFEPLPLVSLSRPVRVGGRRRLARFSVVRPPPEKMPEGRIQFVEQRTPENIWLPEHLRHANGVAGLAAALVVADDPVAVAARFARFAGILPRPSGGFVRLPTARGDVLVGTRKAWTPLLGVAPPPAPSIAGYALAFRDPAKFAARCKRAGMKVKKSGGLYAVALPPVLGGAWVFGTRPALARRLAPK
jgi:hypothetical protein